MTSKFAALVAEKVMNWQLGEAADSSSYPRFWEEFNESEKRWQLTGWCDSEWPDSALDADDHDNYAGCAPGLFTPYGVWNPRADIFHAMALEKKLSHFVLRRQGPDSWQCESAHCGEWGAHVTNDCGCKHANAKTPALAVSIAACRAYGVSESEIKEAMNEGDDDTQP